MASMMATPMAKVEAMRVANRAASVTALTKAYCSLA